MATTEEVVPDAMVLVFQPKLTHSVWEDFECRARTRKGLIKILAAGVRCGQWVGYRLMTIERDVMGNVPGVK